MRMYPGDLQSEVQQIMVDNRIARQIDPTADAEGAEYRDGVIAGYHEAGVALAKQNVLNDEEIDHSSTGCKNADWCRGWASGYRVRIDRWYRDQAVAVWEHEGGTNGANKH